MAHFGHVSLSAVPNSCIYRRASLVLYLLVDLVDSFSISLNMAYPGSVYIGSISGLLWTLSPPLYNKVVYPQWWCFRPWMPDVDSALFTIEDWDIIRKIEGMKEAL